MDPYIIEQIRRQKMLRMKPKKEKSLARKISDRIRPIIKRYQKAKSFLSDIYSMLETQSFYDPRNVSKL